MFPYNPNRKLSNNAKMFVRQLELANSNSCSNKVIGSTGNIYNGMNHTSNMTSDTLCQLGQATQDQMKEISEHEQTLSKATNKISNYLTKLNKEKQKLDTKMIESLKRSEQDVIEYDTNVNNIETTQKQLISVSASEEDTNLEMISQNIKFTGWTALAVVAVIAGIKATR
jgi:hypothetical protein